MGLLSAAVVPVVLGIVALAPATSALSSEAFSTTSPAAISVHPGVGQPATTVFVSGSGFGRQEAVDVYFDRRDEALAATDSTGSFSGIDISVPAWAAVGTHWVTAVGRRTGRAAQTRFVVGTNWPQFGFNASHSRYNPFESVLAPSNVPGLQLAWSQPSFGASLPVVAGGVVYAGGNVIFKGIGNVYAFDAAAGHKLWSHAIIKGSYASGPAVAGGVVYVGAGPFEFRRAGKLRFTPSVYALDASTGRKLWSYTAAGGDGGEPTVTRGVVYIAVRANYSHPATVYALRASTGHKLWSHAPGGYIEDSSPAVAGGTVYIGSGHKVYALNAYTGYKRWSYTTGRFVDSSPAVANGVVYVGSEDHKVYALDASTGRKLWSYTTGGAVSSSAAIANGVVYIGSDKLYALDASTGQERWSFTAGGAISSSPAIANGVVYIGSADDKVYGVDAATGQELWSALKVSGAYGGSPTVANGQVYVNSDKLYAFDLAGTRIEVSRPTASRLKPNRSLRASN